MQQGPEEKTVLMDVPWPDEPPVLGPGQTFGSMTDTIADAVLTRPIGLGWLAGLAIGMGLVALLMAAVTYLFLIGVGIWGIEIPVAWGFAIINFVWWIGIGHAGTLISAILLLLKQTWRNSINRFAEAMTLFAVACAGMFPLLHMGRPWLAYWMFPYPSSMGVWPQFRSPLVWDVFAVSTYATISAVFWYVGLVPDFATMREKASHPLTRKVYGILGLGWRGSARHWKRYEALYILLAGIATPLVLSVHTVVSFDFAVAIVPGWHTTIFPPYFVAGAIYSGFAMVLVLAIPIRHYYRLESMITMRHLQNSAKIMLATGLIVGYGYFFEAFIAFYSGSTYERFMMQNRWFGSYAVFLLVADSLQPGYAAGTLVPKDSRQHQVAVPDLTGDSGGHVAGALHHHRHQPQPRLSALIVGSLRRHPLGLCGAGRHHRLLHCGHLYLHSHHAGYFDLRDAHATA